MWAREPVILEKRFALISTATRGVRFPITHLTVIEALCSIMCLSEVEGPLYVENIQLQAPQLFPCMKETGYPITPSLDTLKSTSRQVLGRSLWVAFSGQARL